MENFLDLTKIDIEGFKEKIESLSILDKNVLALKITKEAWRNPFQPTYKLSEEDRFYMDYYSQMEEDESDISMTVKSSVHAKMETKKDYINPFNSLKMFWLDSNYHLMSDSKYENRFSGFLDKPESVILKEFLSSHIGYQVFYGQRRFLIQKEILPNYESLQEINKKWNCDNSEKIQDWYFENNSQYRSEIISVGGRDKKVILDSYEEIYLSNMSLAETKQLTSKFINKQTTSPYEIIPVRKEKQPQPIVSKLPPPSTWDYIPSPDEEHSHDREKQKELEYDYSSSAKDYYARNPGDNYDDYLYFERVRKGEE